MGVLIPGKILYLANLRTGSTATREALKALPGAQLLWPQHIVHTEVEGYSGEFMFTAVRNPYDVLVTWYALAAHMFDNDFVRFLREWDHPQFLRGPNREMFWQCAPGVHTIRWESLKKDLNEILRRFELPEISLPRVNVTRTKCHWRSYYTPEAFAAANERFGHLFERHGYQMVSPGSSTE